MVFSVSIVSRFVGRPKVFHLAVVKRILTYVKGFDGCGNLFPAADTGRKCNLLSNIDSNWCGDKDDWKSTIWYIFMFSGTPISWCSKKEPVVALSSCEDEYIVVSLCAWQVVWLMNLLEELGNSDGEAVTLLVDNVSAINLAKNPIIHGRSKHIEMMFHYLRDLLVKEDYDWDIAEVRTKLLICWLREPQMMCSKRLKMNMSMKDLEHLN